MRIQVPHVPGCPDAAVLAERLAPFLAAQPDVHLERQVVTDDAEAVALGMSGSPTLLIDGADPFAEPDLSPSLSCRLYRDPDGHLSGTPSLTQLCRALATAENGHAARKTAPPE
ncbi:thioredoxin family protein [Amycolatopsis sp. NPDC051372]|uniref:thioredoxin family protein n=1 Tax=unclassified Amycolatopsis TaxID=2618356 RepID=UPI00342548AB